MVSIRGERFDLMQPGRHVLLNIPRFAGPQEVLLRVVADAEHMGIACADMYIQAVNLTGRWVDAKRHGANEFHFSALSNASSEWMSFGRVDLKVVHGHTGTGVQYLNLFARHLGQAGYPVGGLLGEDDHTAAATPMGLCKYMMSLARYAEPPDGPLLTSGESRVAASASRAEALW